MSPVPQSRDADPRHRILIVEDDYLVALQFENALTEAGYDVVDIASTAEEAVQIVPDYRPELVLMDVRLAGPRDGIQAAEEILDRFGIRSIFVSAFSDPATRARAGRRHRAHDSFSFGRGAEEVTAVIQAMRGWCGSASSRSREPAERRATTAPSCTRRRLRHVEDARGHALAAGRTRPAAR